MPAPNRCPEPFHTVWRHAVHTHDAREQAIAQRGWDLEYEQMSAGAFAGAVDLVQLPGVGLIREQANQSLRQRGDVGRDGYLLAVLCGQDAKPAIFCGQPVLPGQLMAGPSQDLDLSCPPGFELCGIVMEAEVLHQGWTEHRSERLPAWMSQPQVLPLASGSAAGVHHLFSLVAQAAADLPAGMDAQLARDDALTHWLDLLPADVRSATSVIDVAERRRVVRQACDLLLQRDCDRALSIPAVCERIGVSHRKLNYCFDAVLGVSPLRYRRQAMLNRVRWALQSAPAHEGVHDVASQWGFWHMGQFSRDYRQMFGEAPSVTRQHARDRMAAGT